MISRHLLLRFIRQIDKKLITLRKRAKIYLKFDRTEQNLENCKKISKSHGGVLPNFYNFRQFGYDYDRFLALIFTAFVSSCFLIYEFDRKRHIFLIQAKSASKSSHDQIYTRADVKKHSTKESGIWVTYKDGVYDITNFVDVHPGGDKILLAAGGSIDPFWSLYAVHKTPEVLEILEEMRIGTLDPKESSTTIDETDPYAHDPQRHPALIACSQKPYNAETPPQLLNDSFFTPNELFFVRNHLPVPKVDSKQYKLEVGGLGLSTRVYTLDDLKRKFKPVKVSATLQCAGNRRNEMNPIKPVKGLEWKSTAISNAEWTGVRLIDVLAASGFDFTKYQTNPEKYANLRHVQFEGLDADPTGSRYGASIEIDKAVDPKGDVILAYEMNGQPLPLDHGYPLRAIVPGVVGARNVKWLAKIFVSDEESRSHWQRNDYKSFSPSTDWDTVDFTKAPSIQEYPVQSAICVPQPEQTLKKGTRELEVKGYAWSGGGRGVIRVDVSIDGGRTWHVANLDHGSIPQPPNRSWAWTLWTCKVNLPEDVKGPVHLICKATDVAYNSQPDGVAGIWNLRGVLNNAWHRVNVNVE